MGFNRINNALRCPFFWPQAPQASSVAAAAPLAVDAGKSWRLGAQIRCTVFSRFERLASNGNFFPVAKSSN